MHRTYVAWLGLVLVGLFAPSCREATSVEVEVETDLPCEEAKVVTTSITSGSLGDYERRPPSAVTTRCDVATGRIGSLVFVPSDDDRAEIAIRIVTARNDRDPELCLSRNAAECIIARRVVRFVPHRTLRLSVRMQQVCSGVTCPDGESCFAGACAPAFVSAEELEPDPIEPEPDPVVEERDASPVPIQEAGASDAAQRPPPLPVEAGGPADAGRAPVRDAGARDGATDGGKSGKGKDGGKSGNKGD